MIVSSMVKLKALGLAKQIVAGAFINGALIGGAVALGTAAIALNATKKVRSERASSNPETGA